MVTYKISGNDKYRVITKLYTHEYIHIRINFILFSNLGQKISQLKNSKLSLKSMPQLLLLVLHKISVLQKVSCCVWKYINLYTYHIDDANVNDSVDTNV